MKIIKHDLKCVAVQKMVFAKTMPGKKVNDYAPRNTPGTHLRPDGVLYVNDICYGEKYPNSQVDLWFPNDDRTVSRPTIIYIHGGGFIFGDKVMGDPLAVSADRDIDFCAEVAKRGYNVVSVNYALAPEYRFPVQVEQVDQMLGYLTEHQHELGLDMNRVFLGGDSAGAVLSEIYGAVLTNPEYAKRLNIQPSIRSEQIKGLLIDEAALSIRNFESNMNAMLGCWAGTNDLKDPNIELSMNAVKWIVDTYIPSFINSSNQEIWFLDSAQDLAAALEKIGVEYEFFYRGPECDKLEHGYMQRFASNPYAKECFEHMLAFVRRQLEK